MGCFTTSSSECAMFENSCRNLKRVCGSADCDCMFFVYDQPLPSLLRSVEGRHFHF